MIGSEPATGRARVKLPGGGGASVMDAIRPGQPDVRFMALTVSARGRTWPVSWRRGRRLHHQNHAGADLPALIHQTYAGARPVSPQVAGYLLDIDKDIVAESWISRLTPTEREVVNRLAQVRVPGDRLTMGIRVKTLENHMAHIFEN